MRQHRYGARLGVNAQNVVPHVIGDVQGAVSTNHDAIARAGTRQLHENFTFPVGRDPADGLLPIEIDGVDIPSGVTGWSLDAGREGNAGGKCDGAEAAE